MKPADVVGPPHPAQCALVIEVPTVYHLDALEASDILSKDVLKEDNLPFVFHFTSNEVMETER